MDGNLSGNGFVLENRAENRFLVQIVKKIAENKEIRVYLYTNNARKGGYLYR
jgi:hypothetical protein